VTTSATGPRAETEQQTEARMRAVAAELKAAGLDCRVYETRGVLDVRATLVREGCRPVEVTYDGDGYVAITYWHEPGATAARVVGTIKGVLAVITGRPS
jgi:hypothetical protein